MSFPTPPWPWRGWCGALLALLAVAAGGADSGWHATHWQGEAAMEATSHGRRAIVSLARTRLMYFGPDHRDENLLLAPPTRENRNILGGHRLWLGPQSTWAKIWPPPAAWEYDEAASVAVEQGTLRLTMPDAGDGWPRLVRTYAWDGATLVCGAEMSGGTRPAQVIQILQVPAENEVDVTARPDPDHPAGFVELPSTAGGFATTFPVPPHVSRTGDALTLAFCGRVLKAGFRPQPLVGRQHGRTLRVERGRQAGVVAGEPDEGFFTQVYLGGPEPFIELEQLSPLFAPGTGARFEIRVSADTP